MPGYVVGEELIVCQGTVGVSTHNTSVDTPRGLSLEDLEEHKETLVPKRFIKYLKKYGRHPSAELYDRCMQQRRILGPNCLKKSNLTFRDVMVSLLASRPRFISLTMLFGTRSSIYQVGGAYHGLMDWFAIRPTIEMKKYLVRMDLAYSIPNEPRTKFFNVHQSLMVLNIVGFRLKLSFKIQSMVLEDAIRSFTMRKHHISKRREMLHLNSLIFTRTDHRRMCLNSKCISQELIWSSSTPISVGSIM